MKSEVEAVPAAISSITPRVEPKKLTTTHVGSPDLALLNHIVHRRGDRVGLSLEAEVAQHHGSGENHGGGVGLVGAHNVLTDVPTSGLEEGVFATKVAAGDDTGTTDECWGSVRNGVKRE